MCQRQRVHGCACCWKRQQNLPKKKKKKKGRVKGQDVELLRYGVNLGIADEETLKQRVRGLGRVRQRLRSLGPPDYNQLRLTDLAALVSISPM